MTRRHRPAARRRAARGRSPAPTTASGSSGWAWPGAATRRGERLREMRQSSRIPTFQAWTDYLHGLARSARRRTCSTGIVALGALKIQDDPEAIFQEGWLLCDVGEHERGLGRLRARRRQGLLRRADAGAQPAVRRAARRRRLSRRSWPRRRPAASARWRRSARPAASACSAVTCDEDAGTAARQAPRSCAAERPSVPTARVAGAGCRRTRWSAILSDAFRMAIGREAGQPRQRPAPAHGHQVDRAVRAAAVAARHPDAAGDRSGAGRHRPGRFRRGRRGARGAGRADHGAATQHHVAGASDLRPDVGAGLAALGLPAHGPSPAAVRRVGAVAFGP